jgi:hypothetical protein
MELSQFLVNFGGLLDYDTGYRIWILKFNDQVNKQNIFIRLQN